jgi:hypothetical protein
VLLQASTRPQSNPGGRNLRGAILRSCRFPSNTAVLLADRTRDVRTVTTVVTEVLEANPDTSPLDIETALRTANGQAYLVANRTTVGFQIVLGTPAWQAAFDDAGLTVEQNWAALAGARPKLRAHAGMAPVSLSGRRDQFMLVLR